MRAGYRAIPHQCFHPMALAEAEGQVECWQYPGLDRQTLALHRPCAAWIRVGGLSYLLVSLAVFSPFDVSRRYLLIFLPSFYPKFSRLWFVFIVRATCFELRLARWISGWVARAPVNCLPECDPPLQIFCMAEMSRLGRTSVLIFCLFSLRNLIPFRFCLSVHPHSLHHIRWSPWRAEGAPRSRSGCVP